MGTMWGGGLCSAGAGEIMWRQPAQLVLAMWSCPHCSLTAEFCIGAGAHHRAPQLGALSQAPPHTPSLPPRLAWHCPTPPTPACSRTIFQMDVSILLLVIKTRGQRCLAQLCTEGAGHSPDSLQLHYPGQQLPPRTQWAGDRQLATPIHPRLAAVAMSQLKSLFLLGCSLVEPTPTAVPASALPGLMLAAGWLLALAEVGTEQDLEWGDNGEGMARAWGGGKGARKGVLTACAQPARGPHSPRKKSPAERV